MVAGQPGSEVFSNKKEAPSNLPVFSLVFQLLLTLYICLDVLNKLSLSEFSWLLFDLLALVTAYQAFTQSCSKKIGHNAFHFSWHIHTIRKMIIVSDYTGVKLVI